MQQQHPQLLPTTHNKNPYTLIITIQHLLLLLLILLLLLLMFHINAFSVSTTLIITIPSSSTLSLSTGLLITISSSPLLSTTFIPSTFCLSSKLWKLFHFILRQSFQFSFPPF
ncbi:hypothetical protein RYX36_030610 [Vicia faba]